MFDLQLRRVSLRRWLALVCLAALLLAGASAQGAPVAVPLVGDEASTPPPLVLDERPEPLKPLRARTEAEADALEALAMFSAGRVLEQQGSPAEALRMYQRALRYDPAAATIAEAIVPLAAELNRHEEAIRYALKLAEMGKADPLLLRRLGAFLVEQGDWREALALYEKAAAGRGDAQAAPADAVLAMELGRLYYLAADYPKSAEHFGRALAALEHPAEYGLDEPLQKALLGEAAATYSLIGDALVRAGRVDEATAAFAKAHAAKPDEPLFEYHNAQTAARRGDHAAALARLEAAFAAKLSTGDTAPYRLLAEVLEALGKSTELMPRLEKLYAADAENAALGYFLAERYAAQENSDRAEPLYRKLVEQRPTAAGYQALIEIYRGRADDAALVNLLSQVVGKTGSLEVLGEKGEALAADAALVERLVVWARQRLAERSAEFGYEHRLAVALLASAAKQFDAAGEFFDRAIESKPGEAAEILLTRGLGLLVADRYAEAVAVFTRAVGDERLREHHAAFYYYLAGALEMEDKTDEALAAARKAVELQADSPLFHSRVGWIFYHAGRHAEASAAYGQMVERFKSEYGSAGVREALREARLVLSNLAVLQDDIPAAEEWLEEVLDEFPDDISAHNDLGYLWADEGKHLARARRMVEKAVAAEPDNEAYRDSLGWTLYRLGDLPGALEQLQKAAAVAEPDAVILEHLGDVLQADGKVEAAREAWQKALEALRQATPPDAEKIQALEQKLTDLAAS